jgi:hypothetical protein
VSSAYLPFVARSWTAAEVAVTAHEVVWGYPTYHHLYGYARSPLDRPLYSVALDLDVTFWAYYPGGIDVYTTTIRISPAMTATLPSQVNPFSYDLTLGRADAFFGEIRAAAGTTVEPAGEAYFPLHVVDWTYGNGTVSGTVRNDSGRPLHKARVVVVNLTECPWREAQLLTRTLQPGQTTNFQRTYYESCQDGDFRIIGQGAAQP